MAIFGAGSKWDDQYEQKEDFFKNNNYEIGWDYQPAKDLYASIASFKTGDIIYLKGSAPGSRSIKVKGIGIVIKPLGEKLFESNLVDGKLTQANLSLDVCWIYKEEFHINIPSNEGKLTNVRAATIYEEFLPFVQREILDKIFSKIAP